VVAMRCRFRGIAAGSAAGGSGPVMASSRGSDTEAVSLGDKFVAVNCTQEVARELAALCE
jgi:hypothetical protein